MTEKKVKTKEENKTYVCFCGSSSFIQEGLANFREKVNNQMRPEWNCD